MESLVNDLKNFVGLFQILFSAIVQVLVRNPLILLIIVLFSAIGGKGFKFKLGNALEVKR